MPISKVNESSQKRRCDLQEEGQVHNVKSLRRDPLRRFKMVNGEETTKVMMLCQSCYRKALYKGIASEGMCCDLQKEKEVHKIDTNGLRRDPLKRVKVVNGEETPEVMKLCQSCYRAALHKRNASKGMCCDLQKEGEVHTINTNGLRRDPLKRVKEVKGKKTTEVMKLCFRCYRKAKVERDVVRTGRRCDLQEEGKVHKIDTEGLKRDPLERFKMVNGEKTTEVMKLCRRCYCKAIVERDVIRKERRCDLQEEGEVHKIDSSGLKGDPLKRFKVVNGKETPEVMKLCRKCYQVALYKIRSSEGKCCDLQKEGEVHKIDRSGLKKDPLKRVKVVNGEETSEVMKLCQSCYRKALHTRSASEGRRCDLQEEGGEPHTIDRNGLTRDPLERFKVVDGKEEVMKLCQSCCKNARVERDVVRTGRRCDLQEKGSVHNISRGLTRDPLKRVKVVNGKEEVMQLCRACYQQARKKKREVHKKTEVLHGVIKQEPEHLFEGDRECKISAVKMGEIREINNTLPILQDPKNPERSLLLEQEGPIQKIRCANWNALPNIRKHEKRQITQQVREWLRLNEYDREQYTSKLEEYLEVAVPVDEGPNRGLSVFAKKDIPAYQVVCPYAGALLDKKGLENSIKKNGSAPVLSYLFETRSLTRKVDALKTGNVASLVNTSALGNGLAFKENNLEPLIFGKNVVVYVSPRVEIKKGTELFIDYGPTYNPLQLIEESQVKIKQEVV